MHFFGTIPTASVIDDILQGLARTPLISIRIQYIPVEELEASDNPNGEELWKSRLEQVLPWSASLLHLELRESVSDTGLALTTWIH